MTDKLDSPANIHICDGSSDYQSSSLRNW